jgi:chromosomal replication initiator protein
MAKASVIAGAGGLREQRPGVTSPGDDANVLAARLAAALRDQIGSERHAVWFGDSVKIVVSEAGVDGTRVVMQVANAFSREWLKRSFGDDVDSVVRQVCGRDATVAWHAETAGAEPAATAAGGRRGAATRRAAPGPREAGGRSRPRVGREPAAARPVAMPPEEADAPVAGPAARRPAADLGSFVVGPSNRMAFAAVEIAALRPGEMSPLVLHGPTGVGKSHLLEGICSRFRDVHPGATAILLSGEQFTTSFLQALHGSGLPGFRRTCRSVDLLAIDDLQFFAGKRATLMELQQTVDAFHRQGKQVVFASDRDPAALDGLGAELVARLRGGMSARIEPPDYDVRRGVVAAVAAKRGLELPDEVVHYVATHMTRHARELIGALNRLEAASHMLGLPVTPGMAEDTLADLVRSSARSVRLADVERAICSAFGIESGCLQSARRARTVNHPRMLAMFLARRHTTSALSEIGSYFGRRSHSTVISAQKTVEAWVSRRSQIVLADATWDVEDAIRRVEEVLRAG